MNKHSRSTSHVFHLAVLALAMAGAGSAIAASVPADSSGTVVAPIKIEKAADLIFGSFAAGADPGVVTISTSGARTKSGGVTLISTAGGAARFTVTGATGASFGISLSGTTLTSGSDTMSFTPVSDLTGAKSPSGTVTTGTLAGGTQTLYVGGALAVLADQAAGTYTGSLTATVEYN